MLTQHIRRGLGLATLFLFGVSTQVSATQVDITYQQPAQEIVDIADAPPAPGASLSPGGRYLIIQDSPALPPLTDLAEPEYRLAGRRINPANNTISQTRYMNRLRIVDIENQREREISGFPKDARLTGTSWAPDGRHFAVLNMEQDRVSLWLVDAENAEASQWTDIRVNAVWGSQLRWSSDSQSLFVMAVDSERGDEPQAPAVPAGPNVTESRDRLAPARTYQDLLAGPHDEILFDYYFNSQLTRVSVEGDLTQIGEPAVYNSFSLSPDSQYLLITELQRPYSYAVPQFRFARTTEVWDTEGEVVYQVVEQRLADDLPISFDAVVDSRRSISWRNDADATLVWAKAADGGDPREDVEIRDEVFQLAAPFEDEPTRLLQLTTRYSSLIAADDGTALVWERWWNSREEKVWRLPADGAQPQLLWERSWQDRYADPGNPISVRNEHGRRVLYLDDDHILLAGDGASDEGDRPFIDRMNIVTGETERLWRSESPYYESARALLDPDSLTFLTQRESVDQPADFYLRTLGSNELTALTDTPHPMPHTMGITRELIHYEREDGLAMSATLFLPAGYDKERDGPLPTIVWAYPREYRSAADAAQVSGSPYEFNRISYWRPQFLATQGYAVFDNATMPIVGEGDAQPNDTFIEQLIMNSEAVIKTGVERGVTDANRVALGGHSYGAFMTANVLAHTDLFQAGIARSGAYNRSLTPFGFQREERTVWDDPQLYVTMSPFFAAHQIKTPLLLIHGEEDNNSGTFPMQSERLYHAIKGLGGTTRLVMLPYESHGYRARESVLHMLWETVEWLDEFVKNAESN